jgi:tetratricopeptide (TPR) repeat protein
MSIEFPSRISLNNLAWPRLMLWLGLVSCYCFSLQHLPAQDRVTLRLSDNIQTHVRQGVVIDWKGSELQMELSGRVTTIKNDRIINVETTWTTDHQLARELIQKRQFAAAITPLRNALATESREWVQRIVLAELVRVLDFAGQSREACEAYMLLLKSDPESRDFATLPLAWMNTTSDAATIELARKMVDSSLLPIQLLGASWLLTSPDRAAAIKKLEELSRDIDSRIAHLATAQVWRAKLLELDETQLGRWERQIERMPKELRPGPWLMLGQGQSRLGQVDEAILSWMHVPILHTQNYRGTASALQQAATALQNKQDFKAAERLWNELLTQFPDSSWAIESQTALSQIQEQAEKQKGP